MSSSSLEDYLEAILGLTSEGGGDVGVTELGERLGVSKPSVSIAMKKLVSLGLIEHERYGRVLLTEDGNRKAADVARRHELLVRFLHDVLGVDPAIAEEDGCRLEHHLSTATVEKLTQFVEFLTGGKRDSSTWQCDFSQYLSEGKNHGELVNEQRR